MPVLKHSTIVEGLSVCIALWLTSFGPWTPKTWVPDVPAAYIMFFWELIDSLVTKLSSVEMVPTFSVWLKKSSLWVDIRTCWCS